MLGIDASHLLRIYECSASASHDFFFLIVVYLRLQRAVRSTPNWRRSKLRLVDIVGISVNAVVNGETVAELRAEDLPTRDLERVVKQCKQLAVQRHLRIAEQYIRNVGLGKFPMRVRR